MYVELKTKTDKLYWWIDEDYIDQLINDYFNGNPMARRYLLVHLLHLRRANFGKISWAGEDISKKNVGIENPYWKESIQYLKEHKFLDVELKITKRNNKEKRFEIYPLYCENGNGEKRDEKKCKPVWIAMKLMDEGCFATLNLLEIFSLLLAYKYLNLRNFFGVDWKFISYIAETKELSTDRIEILRPDEEKLERFTYDNKYKEFISAFLSLRKIGILEWVPVIIETPEYDPDMTIVKEEIKPTHGSRVCKPMKAGQHVRWILRPANRFIPRTKMYKEWITQSGIKDGDIAS